MTLKSRSGEAAGSKVSWQLWLLQSNYTTSYFKNTMQIILVDGKAWERHRSAFADFIYRIERLTSAIRPRPTNGSTTTPYAAG